MEMSVVVLRDERRTDILSFSEFLELGLQMEVRLRLQLELQLLAQQHSSSFCPCWRLVWMMKGERALRCGAFTKSTCLL